MLKILLVYCKLDTDLQDKSFQLKSGNIVSDTSDFFSRWVFAVLNKIAYIFGMQK